MQLRQAIILVPTLLAVSLCAGNASGQEWYSSRSHHPWGRFKVGSWKRVRLTTDQLKNGKVIDTTTTEVTTTLVAANETCYTLRIDVARRHGDTFYCSPARHVRRYFGPELNGKLLGDLILRNDTYVCGDEENTKKLKSEVRQVTYSQDGLKRVTRVHFNPQQAPYLLGRETTSKDEKGNTTYQTSVQTADVNIMKEVNGVPQKVSMVTIAHVQNGQRTETTETQSVSIPGFVIGHQSTVRVTGSEQVVRRSRLELIDYSMGRGTAQFNNYGKRGLRHRRLERRRRRNRTS